MVTVPVLLLALAAGLPRTAAAQGDKDLKVEYQLTKDDPKDKVRKDCSAKIHTYKMKAGEVYIIDMVSKEFDTYLRLEDPTGKQVAEDDDSGGDLNARIIYQAAADGDHKIICTAFAPSFGNFTLTVRKGTKDDLKKINPHALMLDKPAPDIAGDYCVNGKVEKLSDLRGKVVLVDFWAVWCGPCVATFPHLRDWSKEHGKDGLVILGVTTYYEQFSFDKDKGKLDFLKDKKLSQADERDMVRAFGEHHKLTHPLLLTTKDNWTKASQDYAVKGIPTAVLIDRKGVVRMIRVGAGDDNANALHEEMKKLLAEK
jgi:thiol-disulfide isomerase/thioredoxin